MKNDIKIKSEVIKKRKRIKVNNIDKNNVETTEDVESNKNNNSTDHGKGDQMVNIDENETLRILSKNPRGFCFEDGKDDKITAGIEYFHDAQAGAILAQETNTDWKKHKTRGKLRNKLFKYWKYQNITTSVSDTKARISSYLPGGTATAILGKWSSRIMATGSDKRQGRWSWTRLQRNTDDKGNFTNIRLINAYQVCQ